jgi:hypothetical protein
MNVAARVASEDQLVRLLQVGVVLEEVFEARADHHYRNLLEADREAVDDAVVDLLTEATEDSAEYRRRLEALIDELDGETKPDDFDDLLYDQLHSEESAYKFYDDLIEGIENSDAAFGVSRERLIETLDAIREQEAEGVERVTQLMETR